MKFIESPLQGCYSIDTDRLSDTRGWFSRTYCRSEFHGIGFEDNWVQHNHSFTAKAGTIRGMHYQKMPSAEIKLIRCISGKVFDVAVDLRSRSNTYLKWFSIELCSEKGNMIYIPKGFAHGFQTLTDKVELLYCHSEFYKPENEAGLNWNDQHLGIHWPLDITEISERDNKHAYINANFEGVNI